MGTISIVLPKINFIRSMLDRFRKISTLNKATLLFFLSITGLAIMTNPSISDYKIHEAKEFGQKFENQQCSNEEHNHHFYYNVTVDIYKSTCKSVVSEFTNHPERLLSLIELNTERANYFILSRYETYYKSKVVNEIREKVKQHPTYTEKNSAVAVSYTTAARDPIIAIFGNFY